MLPPIVPKKYFDIGRSKITEGNILNTTNKLNVIFIGRLDPKKGINKIIKILKDNDLNKILNWTISTIIIESDKNNKNILDQLSKIDNINFIFNDRQKYSLSIENKVCDLLRENSVFVQPYENLKTTVDLPLLILESQAAGCILLTTLPEILNNYLIGESKAFGIEFEENFKQYIFTLISSRDSTLNLDTLRKFEKEYSEDKITGIFVNFIDKYYNKN